MMIAKCSSLTEASERLFITQQSLGKEMKDLETELGTKLLLRTNRGCALTKDGQEAVRQGREILDRVNRLQHCFQHDAIPLRGKLIILCSQVMFSDELPLALEAFTKQYPEVEVTAMEQSRLSGNRSGLYDAVLLWYSQRETNGKQSGAILQCVGRDQRLCGDHSRRSAAVETGGSAGRIDLQGDRAACRIHCGLSGGSGTAHTAHLQNISAILGAGRGELRQRVENYCRANVTKDKKT